MEEKNKPLSSMKVLAVLAINFLAMVFLFLFFLNLIEVRKNDGLLINLSGRQRILSQKLSKNSILYLEQKNPSFRTDLAAELAQDLKEFQVNHEDLRREVVFQEIQVMLQRLEIYYHAIEDGTRDLLKAPAEAEKKIALAKILGNEKNFLALMHETVLVYVLLANEKMNWIQTFVLFSIALLLILFSWNAWKAISLIRRNRIFQNKIQQNNEKLIEVNQSREKLISIIAHDLRSPFHGILGFSKLLLDDPTRFSELERRGFLENIHHQAEHTLNLLENLLQWARLKSSLMQASSQVILFQPLAQDVVKGFSVALKLKSLEVVIDDSCKQEVFADPRMLRAVLRNLLSNALKFSYPGGLIRIQAKAEGEQRVEISVQDYGTGMEEKESGQIQSHGAFYTSSGTSGESGSGLGLEICRELLDLQGGTFGFESEKEKGSRFFFSLPKVLKIPVPEKESN